MKINLVQSYNYQQKQNKNNFRGKLNVANKYLFDAELIKDFVAQGDKVILNFKKRILHTIPSEKDLTNYYKQRTILYKEYATKKIPIKYVGHPSMVASYPSKNYAYEFQAVATPDVAQTWLEEYDNNFWTQYGVMQLSLDMPFESFLNKYSEAIKPENATKIYDILVC